MLITNLSYFLSACIVLIASSIFLVKSLHNLALFLKISDFQAGFIIMAIASSLPELFVGISSAISNNTEISLGNLIGASIIDLTLLIGIFVVVGKGIKTTKEENKDMPYVLASIILMLVLFLINKELSRIDGLILIIFAVFSFYRTLKKNKRVKHHFKNLKAGHSIIIFIISLLFLFLAADFSVKYGSLLASDFKLPKIVIGLILISFATTIPELTFGLIAVKMKHKEMAVGDQTGTIIINIALILGIVALINPIKISLLSFIFSSAFLVLASLLLFRLMKSKNGLGMKAGIALIIFYIAYFIIQIFLSKISKTL